MLAGCTTTRNQNSSTISLRMSGRFDIEENDVMLALLCSPHTGPQPSEDADGWMRTFTVEGKRSSMSLFHKVARSSDVVNPVFNVGTKRDTTLIMSVWRGIVGGIFDTVHDWEGGTHAYTGSRTLQPTNPSVTSTHRNAVSLLMHYSTGAPVVAAGAPTGYTMVGHAPRAFIASKNIMLPGTEVPGAWTHKGRAGKREFIVATLAMRTPPPLAGSTYDLAGGWL